MKAMILCGGMGTRLKSETEYRPKPLVDIGGRPILWHIMKIFAHYGHREFVLCLGYRGHMIKEYFLNYEAVNNDFTICLGCKHEITYHEAHEEQDFAVTLADTGLDAMTGARVKRASKYIDDDTFMVTYGDGVADIDIARLVEFHHEHGLIGTVTTVRPFSYFGNVKTDDKGRVVEFLEKPRVDSWISAGFFVFNKKILDYLDLDDNCVLERGPLDRLAQEGQLAAYRHHGSFFAMDTYRDYLRLNNIWSQGEAPWKVWDGK